jgi:uncharacterized protein (UPF0276 family)
MNRPEGITGAGLGLRRAIADGLLEPPAPGPDFLEVAPENWMGLGGRPGRTFRQLAERHPFVAHGLSLSIGGPEALDTDFIARVGDFLDTHGFHGYSEHLSYCSADGHLYDLMPLPFTEEAVHHVAGRVRTAQEILGRRIALENVSYYATHEAGMGELAFLNAVLEEADCDLLLDVNNIWVNATNHGYDARAFLDGLPAERVAYLHVAGHYREAEDLIIDTHGAPVIDPVWALLEHAYRRLGPRPTLLERDFNLPPLPELLDEVEAIRRRQAAAGDAEPEEPRVHAGA